MSITSMTGYNVCSARCSGWWTGRITLHDLTVLWEKHAHTVFHTHSTFFPPSALLTFIIPAAARRSSNYTCRAAHRRHLDPSWFIKCQPFTLLPAVWLCRLHCAYMEIFNHVSPSWIIFLFVYWAHFEIAYLYLCWLSPVCIFTESSLLFWGVLKMRVL